MIQADALSGRTVIASVHLPNPLPKSPLSRRSDLRLPTWQGASTPSVFGLRERYAEKAGGLLAEAGVFEGGKHSLAETSLACPRGSEKARRGPHLNRVKMPAKSSGDFSLSSPQIQRARACGSKADLLPFFSRRSPCAEDFLPCILNLNELRRISNGNMGRFLNVVESGVITADVTQVIRSMD